MKHFLIFNLLVILLLGINSCADKKYPVGLSNTEKEKYYKKFNDSKTVSEWSQLQRGKDSDSQNLYKNLNDNSPTLDSSVTFSIRNNSIFSKKLRIADNILKFKPLEKRYFGFKPNTEVYLVSGKKDNLLFMISEKDENRELKIMK